MDSAAPEREVSVSMLDDWTGQLDLLAGGTYDVGFPWYKPDCSRASLLAPLMQQRCADFDFSAPLFELAIGYYVRSGDTLAAAQDYEALAGHRICRPADHFTFDLEQQGLAQPGALLFPATAEECFTLLEQGAVDVVTLSRPLAEQAILFRGLVGHVTEAPALGSVQTLHAIAAKSNPNGRAYLNLVNAGDRELHASGRWFEVVEGYLGVYGMRLQ